jgi:hypothetical protein
VSGNVNAWMSVNMCEVWSCSESFPLFARSFYGTIIIIYVAYHNSACVVCMSWVLFVVSLKFSFFVFRKSEHVHILRCNVIQMCSV